MNKMIIILLLLYCTSLFSLGTTTEINSSNTIKEINFLKKQVKQMQLKINEVEWKRENSIDNINNRIESFGNYLEISSNRNEIIIAFFGILMTV
jgi:TolA-binding protein